MPLFELYSYFSSMITFEREDDTDAVHVKVWPPFPRQYNRERWGGLETYVEVVFEYGFSLAMVTGHCQHITLRFLQIILIPPEALISIPFSTSSVMASK